MDSNEYIEEDDGFEEEVANNDKSLIHREDPSADNDNMWTKSDEVDSTDLVTSRDDCKTNPNFAVIVDFLEKFGEHLGIKSLGMRQLESHLTDSQGIVHQDLIHVFTSLLKRAKQKKILITKRSWEKGLTLFCKKSVLLRSEHEKLENHGFGQLDLSVKLRILKVLMEHQFDCPDFKIVTESLPSESLRHLAEGRDLSGKQYWTQIDHMADIRVYAETPDHLHWDLVVESREGLVNFIRTLKENLLYRKEVIRRRENEEKSNSKLNDCEEEERVEPPCDESYNCSVCPEEFVSGTELQAHYARTHLAVRLRDKFSHLTRARRCKLCKEEFIDEAEVFVHLATSHDKINIILKENDLPVVAINNQNEEPENERDGNSPVGNNEESEDEGKLEQLELKIKQVEAQMSSSVKANLDVYALADMKDIEEGKITRQSSKKMKKKKKKKGKPSNKSESNPRRRSWRNVPSETGPEPVVREARRLESRVSCHRCGGWAEEDNLVFSCSHCSHSWHQHCVSPVLLARPQPTWRCPLCSHLDLVTSLDQLLLELDSLIETVEQKRLAELQENQSSMEQEEESDDTEDKEEESKEETLAVSEKETEEEVMPVVGCQCSGAGNCSYCKKMRGCTCDGAGTCRLCEMEMEEDEEDDDIEIIEEVIEEPPSQPGSSQSQMSTTEYYLLTGKVRPPSQTEEPEDDDIQVLDPPTVQSRGRGRGRSPARGQGRGRGRPGQTSARPVIRSERRGVPLQYTDHQTHRALHHTVSRRPQLRTVRPLPPQNRGPRARPQRYFQPQSVHQPTYRPPLPVRPRYSQRLPAPVNLHSSYYSRNISGHIDDDDYGYDPDEPDVVDLVEDEDDELGMEEDQAALVAKLPSGLQISRL